MHRTVLALGTTIGLAACAHPPSAEPVQSSRPAPPESAGVVAAVPPAPSATFVKVAPAQGARRVFASKSTVSSHVDMLLSDRPMSLDVATMSRIELSRECLELLGNACARARVEVLRDDAETSGAPMGEPKPKPLVGQAFLVESGRPPRVSKPEPPPASPEDLTRIRDRLVSDDPDRLVAALPDHPVHVGDTLEELDRALLGELPTGRPAGAEIRNAKSHTVVTAIRREGAATFVTVQSDFTADVTISTQGTDVTPGPARFVGKVTIVFDTSPAAPVSRQMRTHLETSMRQKEVASNIIAEVEETTTWR